MYKVSNRESSGVRLQCGGKGGKGEGVFEVGSHSLSAHGVAALSSRIRGRGGEGRPQKLWFPRKEDEKVE